MLKVHVRSLTIPAGLDLDELKAIATAPRRFSEWMDMNKEKNDAESKEMLEGNLGMAGSAIYWAYKYLDWISGAGGSEPIMDMLKLGESLKKDADGWAVFRDVMRVVSVVPVGRLAEAAGVPIARNAERAAGRLSKLVKELRFLPNPRGGTCFPWSLATAVKNMGWSPYLNLSKLFEHAGMLDKEVAEIFEQGTTAEKMARKFIPALRRIGAAFDVKSARSMKEIEQLARRNPGALVVFTVEWIETVERFGGEEAKAVAHTMVAGWDASVGFRIFDRSGAVARDLAELERLAGYVDIAFGSPTSRWPQIVLRNARYVREGLVALDALNILSSVFLEVGVVVDQIRAAAKSNSKDSTKADATADPTKMAPPRQQLAPPDMQGKTLTEPELQCRNDLEGHRLICDDGNGTKPSKPRTIYIAKKGDGLAIIAKKFYGDEKQFKKLYEANRARVGRPPTYLIHPGTMLVIPE
jgi:hypothetical protein